MNTKVPFRQQCEAETTAAIEAGETGFVIACGADSHGLAGMYAQHAAAKLGFRARMTSETGAARISLQPGLRVGMRGAPKTSTRLDIEDIAPGSMAAFDTDGPARTSQIRGIAQAVARAMGRTFRVETANAGASVIVTRTDSLEQAAPELAAATRAMLAAARASKYGLDSLQPGQSTTVVTDNVESLRALANHYKRRHGRQFRINRTSDGAIITRIL